MMNQSPSVIAIALGACMFSAGCGRAELSGPPELRLGRDECGECGMLVSEDRCSSAMIVVHDGRRTSVVFDDIGCMLDYQMQMASDNHQVVALYVHDYNTRAWLEAQAASYLSVAPEAIVTPMGYGLLAFADASAAEPLQQEHDGQMLGWTQLENFWSMKRSAVESSDIGP